MYLVDITADLNDEDETGYVWTFLDEARDPGQIRPGALVVAGDEEAAAVCQVVDLGNRGRTAGISVTNGEPSRETSWRHDAHTAHYARPRVVNPALSKPCRLPGSLRLRTRAFPVVPTAPDPDRVRHL